MKFVRNHYLKIASTLSAALGGYYFYRTPQYTYQEVYNSKKKLTTYQNNVYDITQFIESHPGGSQKISLAANRHLEPYWNIYKQHFKPEVMEILESMKVGELSDYDPDKFYYLDDVYNNEPDRDKKLVVHTHEPFNAETPKELIHQNPITPNNLWYVRNHHPTPDIKPEKYRLKLYHKKLLVKTLTLDEIKKMPKKKIITTMQCGGNRRGEFDNTSGTQWDIGAISTAEWEGVPLHQLLDYEAEHIHFTGYDGVKVSIPFKKGADCLGDVLIAYKMNGEDIPRDHGYPVRIIVPGYVGIRNIKWLEEIILEDEEVDSPWQKGISYKILPSTIRCLEDVSKINLEEFDTIQELPIQSCITYIEKLDEKGHGGENYRIHGYAYSSKPFEHPKVNVSFDNGESWYMAGINKDYEELKKLKWSWCLWSVSLNIPQDKFTITCKAFTEDGEVQPDNIKDIWNIRGLANNSVHQVTNLNIPEYTHQIVD